MRSGAAAAARVPLLGGLTAQQLSEGAAAKVFIIGHKRAENVRPGTARAEAAATSMTTGA